MIFDLSALSGCSWCMLPSARRLGFVEGGIFVVF